MPVAAVELLGQRVDRLTEAEVVTHILAALDDGRGGWVATHNLDHLRRLTMDGEFAALCRTASLRTADGAPLLWAARLQGTPLPERVAGSNLTVSLSAALAKQRRSVFLLGGNPGTAEAAGEVLTRRYPGLRIAGTCCPDVGFEADEAAVHRLRAELVAARPDVVYVALGSPKQERLIVRLLDDLPQAWFLGVGISLSFITGEVHRAPVWMQHAGLEWMHRLAQEPRRLARRYLAQGIPFAARLLAHATTRGLAGRLAMR